MKKIAIERVSEFNFLGVWINEQMNWKKHTLKLANKVTKIIGIMNKLKRFLPFPALKLMYSSLVVSHLQYGISSWGFECNRLIKLQKRAIRMITNESYNAHTDPIFKELKLPK